MKLFRKKTLFTIVNFLSVTASLSFVACDGDDANNATSPLEGASITLIDTTSLSSDNQIRMRMSVSTEVGGGTLEENSYQAKIVETDVNTGKVTETTLSEPETTSAICQNIDRDKDGYTPCATSTKPADCDDYNAAINPGASEVCDNIDNNCNNQIDEGYDKDKDGHTPCQTTQADCNDSDSSVFGGATEICDGKDNNCNSKIDDGLVFVTYYEDKDSDTYGATSSSKSSCSKPSGYVNNNTDCNDADAKVFPGAEEVCDNVDNNCDNIVDENTDRDNDGVKICGGDCNDENANISPNATEVCDGLDNDCQAGVDEGFDSDGDSFSICSFPTADCDDSNAAIYPTATELCDQIDNNCDTRKDETFDLDDDGFVSCLNDCNDLNTSVHDGATEVCDGLDNDCDNEKDEDFDFDNDGFSSCGIGSNANVDCNDSDSSINQDSLEICDGVDNDCDFLADETGVDENGNTTYCEKYEECNIVAPAVYPLALSIVIDRSGSINNAETAYITTSTNSAVAEMELGDLFEIINFNSTAYIDQSFTDNEDLLYQAISSPSVSSGNTAVWDSLSLAIEQTSGISNSYDTARAVLILTDGQDNASSATVSSAISAAIENKIPVFTIGYDFGGNTDDQDLQSEILNDISSQTGGRYYENTDSVNLSEIFTTIVNSMQSQYDICYETAPSDGPRTVKITLTTSSGGKLNASAYIP